MGVVNFDHFSRSIPSFSPKDPENPVETPSLIKDGPAQKQVEWKDVAMNILVNYRIQNGAKKIALACGPN